MTKARTLIARAQALPRRLRRRVDRLGVPGVIGVALLVSCAGFYAGTIHPLRLQVESAPAVVLPVQRLAPRTPADDANERLHRFAATFPDEADVARLLARLYALGDRAGVRLAHGEYRFVDADALGMVQYRVTLPIAGSYPQVRGFISAVLNGVPSAAVTQLTLQRERVGAGQIEARVELTLHLRGSGARVAQDATAPQRLSAAPEPTQ